VTGTDRLLKRDNTSSDQTVEEAAPPATAKRKRPNTRFRLIRILSARFLWNTCRTPQRAMLTAVVCCGLAGGIWTITSDGATGAKKIVGEPTKPSTQSTSLAIDLGPESDLALHAVHNESDPGFQKPSKGLLPFDVIEDDESADDSQSEIVPAGGVIQKRQADGAAWLLGTIEEATSNTSISRSDDLPTSKNHTTSR
jgi:hypothetical protein